MELYGVKVTFIVADHQWYVWKAGGVGPRTTLGRTCKGDVYRAAISAHCGAAAPRKDSLDLEIELSCVLDTCNVVEQSQTARGLGRVAKEAAYK